MLGSDGFMAFFSQQAAGHSHQHREQTKTGAQDSVLMLLRASDPFLQVRERQQSDEAHRIRAHHTERGEAILLIIIGGHHIEQGAVRHIDHRVACHHQQIEGVRPNTLADRS